MQHAGIAAAISAAAVAQLVTLLVFLRRRAGRLGLREVVTSSLRVGVGERRDGRGGARDRVRSAAGSAAATTPRNVAVFIAAIVAGSVVFLIAARVLRAPELADARGGAAPAATRRASDDRPRSRRIALRGRRRMRERRDGPCAAAASEQREPIVILDASFVGAAHDARSLPGSTFAEVAFAGRSNVGKSSLINALVARRNLVRTSSTPGATRAVNLFRVKLRGELAPAALAPTAEGERTATLDLIDLPGYGYAKRSKKERAAWGELVDAFLHTRRSVRAIVVIVDARRGAEDDDLELVELIEQLDARRDPGRDQARQAPGQQAQARARGDRAARRAARAGLQRGDEGRARGALARAARRGGRRGPVR